MVSATPEPAANGAIKTVIIEPIAIYPTLIETKTAQAPTIDDERVAYIKEILKD